uniref:Methyltransferase-like protein 4 n=1 Tax=Plectus sambesii TaxID=2011161 RepID=A0A914UIV4_9BILA
MLVGQTANCAILDDWAYHDNVYKQSRFAPKKVLYDISEPFRMDSQVAALEKTKNEGKERRKRKRPQLNCYVDPKFQQTCEHVAAVHADIVNLGQSFFHEKQEDSFTNNKDARAAANELSGLDALPCSSGQMSSFVEVDLVGSNSLEWRDDCCVLWRNSSDDCIMIELSNSKYVLPPRSAFILGDASLSRHLIQSSRTFDFILLDPPWENKAVKRQKTYATSFEDDLLSLPIDTLLAENGLVAIWVTNNQRLQRFVEGKLLAKWNLQKLARWHWLKLTTRGEFVCDFKPHYKVPFERIRIRFNAFCSALEETAIE